MASDAGLKAFMQGCQERVERTLEQLLPPSQTLPTRLHQAMRYAALGSGKRIRPTLVYASGRAAGVEPERLDRAACAVELIHAYSLVHDDLPAMDDDELRRGRATCHRAFDEATAILTGDALQSLAFQLLATAADDRVNASTRLAMVEILARASGSRGMAGGQALDLAAVGQTLNLAELENLHIHKTGALICASVRFGAMLNPSLAQERFQALVHYAKCIGLAFQIQDDILDVEGDTETLGKTQGKDQAQEKSTYPSLLGLNGAREKARELQQQALEGLNPFHDEADPLRWLARYITGRNH